MNATNAPYPVTVTGELSQPPGRWLWLVKWLLLFPHYVCLGFLMIGFGVVWIIAFFAILFTGKFPKGLFDYNVGVLRWSWRIGFYGYSALGTNKYPPFTLESVPDYPADLQVEYPEKLSRGLVLIKWWLLAIPQYIISFIFIGGDNWIGIAPLLAFVSAIVLLFTGKYPAELFGPIVGMNRWAMRTCCYAALMTDVYPPFRLDD